MKKVYIHGSYRGNNFGDYLLFKLIDDAINKNEYAKVFDHISSMYGLLNPVESRGFLKAIFSSDMIVCAGGGFLGEPSPQNHHWNIRCLYFHMGPLFLASLLGKPVAIIGTEIGDLSSVILRKMLKFILRRASIVSVRNNESLQFVRKLVPEIKAEAHPDWVLTTSFDNLFDKREKINNNKRIIFLHIMNNDINFLEEICKGVNSFLEENMEFEVITGTDHDTEVHLKAVDYISKNILKDRVSIHEYNNDPYALFDMLEKVECIITTKLHVGICGIRMQKKVIALPCHPKIKRFYRYINYDSEMIMDKEDTTADKIKKLVTYAAQNKKIYDNKNIILDADKNLLLLNDFLAKNR